MRLTGAAYGPLSAYSNLPIATAVSLMRLELWSVECGVSLGTISQASIHFDPGAASFHGSNNNIVTRPEPRNERVIRYIAYTQPDH